MADSRVETPIASKTCLMLALYPPPIVFSLPFFSIDKMRWSLPVCFIFFLYAKSLHRGSSLLSQPSRGGRFSSRFAELKASVERDLDYEVYGVRINAKSGDPEIFQELYDGQLPVVLREAFHENHFEGDSWTKHLIERLGSKTVQFDMRDAESGEVEVFEGSFNDFLESCVIQSCHERSLYFISETILSSAQDMMENVKLPMKLFGENYFESCFPEKIRPQTALIVGGFGSRSFLHADPYEWTGWNLLMEGKKLWIFFPPDDKELDELLQPSRNEVDVWGGVNISAGWVSDVDLYRCVSDKEVYISSLGKLLIEHLPVGEEIPFFNSGINEVDNADPRVFRNVVCIIQEEGDMLIIPPKWWHQVYHLEPSIALAGQYFNDRVKENVFNHICEWCNLDRDKTWSSIYNGESVDIKKKVLGIIEMALISQHGNDEGKKIFDSIIFER